MSKVKFGVNPFAMGLMGGLAGMAQGYGQYEQQQRQFDQQNALQKQREDFEQKLKQIEIQSKMNIHTVNDTGPDGKPHQYTIRTSIDPQTGQQTETRIGDVKLQDLQSAQHPQYTADAVNARLSQKDRSLDQKDMSLEQQGANEQGRNDRSSASIAASAARTQSTNAQRARDSGALTGTKLTQHIDGQMSAFAKAPADQQAQILTDAGLQGNNPKDPATSRALRAFYTNGASGNIQSATGSTSGDPIAQKAAQLGLQQKGDGFYYDNQGTQVIPDKKTGNFFMQDPSTGKAVPYQPQASDDQPQVDPNAPQMAQAPAQPGLTGLDAQDDEQEPA
jgi:hypothetical protein